MKPKKKQKTQSKSATGSHLMTNTLSSSPQDVLFVLAKSRVLSTIVIHTITKNTTEVDHHRVHPVQIDHPGRDTQREDDLDHLKRKASITGITRVTLTIQDLAQDHIHKDSSGVYLE